MKACLVFATFMIVCILSATCAPLEDETAHKDLPTLVRHKRVTCDLLSFEAKGVKLNHAACAAHCLVLGKRGGRCSGSAVCVCRN